MREALNRRDTLSSKKVFQYDDIHSLVISKAVPTTKLSVKIKPQPLMTVIKEEIDEDILVETPKTSKEVEEKKEKSIINLNANSANSIVKVSR